MRSASGKSQGSVARVHGPSHNVHFTKLQNKGRWTETLPEAMFKSLAARRLASWEMGIMEFNVDEF